MCAVVQCIHTRGRYCLYRARRHLETGVPSCGHERCWQQHPDWLDTSASVPQPLMLPPAACVVRRLRCGLALMVGWSGVGQRRRLLQRDHVLWRLWPACHGARHALAPGLSPVQLLRLSAGADGGGRAWRGRWRRIFHSRSLWLGRRAFQWLCSQDSGAGTGADAFTDATTASTWRFGACQAIRRTRALWLQARAWRHGGGRACGSRIRPAAHAMRAHADEVERARLLAQLHRTVSPTVPPTPVPSPAPSQSPTPFVTPAPTPPTQAPTPPTPSPTPVGCAPGHYMPRGVQGPASATCFPCPAGGGPGGLARAILQTTCLKSWWRGARVAHRAQLPPPSVATGVWSAHAGELLPMRLRVCAPRVRLGDGHREVVRGDHARSVGAATKEALQRTRYWGVAVARHAYRATLGTPAVCGAWGVAARRMGTGCPAGKILRAASPARQRRIRLLAMRSVSLAAQETMRAAAASSGAAVCRLRAWQGRRRDPGGPDAAGHQSGGWDAILVAVGRAGRAGTLHA